jgi:uncharacterized small protein (DUF1192 family)
VRKRSKYRPKGVIRDPMSHVIAGMKKVGDISSGTTLMIMNHDALESVRKGIAQRKDLDVLIAAMNMAEALIRLEIGDDWRSEVRAAQDALFAVGSRGVETGKFILRGPELTSLNLGMEIHDAQLEACTVAELERAIDIVHNEIRHHRARPIIKKEENV